MIIPITPNFKKTNHVPAAWLCAHQPALFEHFNGLTDLALADPDITGDLGDKAFSFRGEDQMI